MNQNETRAQLAKDPCFVFDEKEWARLKESTPVGFPMGAGSLEEAVTMPGCCLKSCQLRHGSHPLTARLHEYDLAENYVVVLSHAQTFGAGRYVWIGTVRQYEDVWECD